MSARTIEAADLFCGGGGSSEGQIGAIEERDDDMLVMQLLGRSWLPAGPEGK